MIRFEDVHVGFDRKKVLRGFSLEIHPGDKVLISGKSGIGKSTLFRLLLGYVRPDGGRVWYRDSEINPSDAWKIRHETAYVSQSLEMGQGTVGGFMEEILHYRANRGRGLPKEEKEHYRDFLELRPDIGEDTLESLSGGEKQRVAIWTALSLRRDLFLLDEVTSQLDRDMKKKVAGLFLSRPEWTVICVSHDACWKGASRVRRVEMEG
jgi:putative ABC transport system ATP-binding protein